ncbi:MAG TPA: hypothetical protein VJ276_03170 [Thermoanaerobaculia bacterium]|nr:hypothetical protein [Thermoanaerobaculia bacterium]
MPSENAKAVAHEVIETVRKGEKVSIRKIAPKHGYSKATADHAAKITETESYKSVIDPFIQAMKDERDAAIKEAAKKRGNASYRDAIDSIDKLTKNIQLLSGGKTANDQITMTWEG